MNDQMEASVGIHGTVVAKSSATMACLVSITDSRSSLVQLAIADQQLTAVDRFAQWHERDGHEHLEVRDRYQQLIPLTNPGPRQQYAFEVDLDRCTGCKACVTACHQANGLDESETWRSVGLLLGGDDEVPFQQHVTTACHHCIDPACLQGCPVNAYEKDAFTGIVRHLDDQCIGCQYCIWKCPYDVPQYNRELGIVRKCDMCRDRLAANEAPACVQACPNQAIRITIVEQEAVVEECESFGFLPGTPEPGYTLPTTRYVSRQPLPRNLLPADYFAARPQHAHWPLIFMLVLTQASVGTFAIERIAEWYSANASPAPPRSMQLWTALGLGIVGMTASVFHLGRPWLAFRAVLGLRTSWLSREILAFGLFAGMAVTFVTLSWFGANWPRLTGIAQACGIAVVASGLLGVLCSAMIYASTQRPYWSAPMTLAKFLLTCVVLGLPLEMLLSLGSFARTNTLGMLIVAMLVKLLLEMSALWHLRSRAFSPLKRTALLLTGELGAVTVRRLFLGIVGGIALPSFLCLDNVTFSPLFIVLSSTLIFTTVLIGELMERYLFFTAVIAPKMPGVPAS